MARFERFSIPLNSHLTNLACSPYSEPVAAKRKKTWGGARKGAGRPREIQDRVPVTIYFERADTEALRELSQQTGESASALIREAARRLIRRKRSQQ